MAVIYAPFTEEQVRHLNKWQKYGYTHPFTCGSKGLHKPEADDVLIATGEGWRCPSCAYKQNWAHDFMAEEFPNPVADLLHDAEQEKEPELPSLEEARAYLIKEGYDPDEIGRQGALFVKQLSLLTKIKLAVYDVNTDPIERVLIIKGLIQEYESKQ